MELQHQSFQLPLAFKICCFTVASKKRSEFSHPALSCVGVTFISSHLLGTSRPSAWTVCLLLLPSIFSSNFVKSFHLYIQWPKYWSFSFSVSPSNEYSGLISFRTDWFELPYSPRSSSFSPSSRVFSSTIVQKHQFFGTQLSSQSNSHIHT